MVRRNWWLSPRRLPGIDRELGLSTARSQKARDEGAGVGGRRRSSLGFWSAVRDVFPETRHQRDWVHKTANVLDSMPKSVHSRAKAAIHEITCAEDKKHAEAAIEAFAV